MIVALVAPFIYYIIKKIKSSIILLFGAVWLMISFQHSGTFVYDRIAPLSTAFFFFYWGAYMSINKVNMMANFRRLFRPAIAVYLLSSLLYIASTYNFSYYSNFIHRFTILSFVIVTYNFAILLLKRNICGVNKFLIGGSFFIYVSHTLVLLYVERIFLSVIHPINNVTLFAIYILTLVITVLSLLGVYYLLKRFAPPVLKVLTGRC
jgi:hypothetical protein